MKLLEKFLPKKEKYVNLSDVLKDMENELEIAWDSEEKMEKLYEKNFTMEWNGMRVVIPFGAGMYDAITKSLGYMIDEGCEDDVEYLYEREGIDYGN